MSDERVNQVVRHALGLAGALSQEVEAVDELMEVAERDGVLLTQALKRVDEQIERVSAEPSRATDDTGPPEAPALLARRLLQEAIALTEAS
jgi:hypothetical protein